MLMLGVLLTLGVNDKYHVAKLEEFPYHVSIQDIRSSYHHCGGVIINSYYVLTAAHCIDGFNPDEFQIVCGTIDLSKKDMTVHEVEELIPHENYDRSDSQRNDIGLMKVFLPFEFNNHISAAALPIIDADITSGTRATAIGFGRTDPNGYTSKILRKINVTVRTIEECSVAYERAGMHFTDKQICAQSLDGTGICKGDSGGAFVVKGLVVGISSFTNNDCDHQKYPSVFTKISGYRTWIDTNIMKSVLQHNIPLLKLIMNWRS